ncbi:putative isopropanol dehydrogenase [Aspergillus novofumigatus IBT 16806]|uniref:Putative zinc-binding dehydrogenase family oxidoreductase n=1 Tax=Aspergillus novofumigatus (strain IBT 16806) TaxID=1392255 RepID=A0A2I1C132_ASPN1|nr:putative zinc-binding dehydrogenase family oxidoreductase [Aspergillus novofumigatus IBT 16806]PKX91348.1 putative zinc-binding dehydrogenase family oxidoreductase [Aspergillus novofumigatus IBT 16806]
MATHQAIILPEINSPLTLASPYPRILPRNPHRQTPLPLPLPFTPGASPIGRIEATGSDTTILKPGQLVYVDLTVRARDDPLKEQGTAILQGLFGGITPEARILSENDWRHGSWAEKQIVPLENVHVLDESLLCEQMGYSPARLTWINTLLVPYGGLLSGALQPGETVIVCFASGHFGGAAIDVALAMGRGGSLEKIQGGYPKGKVVGVATEGLDGTSLKDAMKKATPRGLGADLFLDFTPASAAEGQKWIHISSAISALKANGRAVLMGGASDAVSLPYSELMMRNITVKGNFMFDGTAPAKLIRLIEMGNLSLSRFHDIEFNFKDYERAIDEAATKTAGDCGVVLIHKG